LVERGDWLYSTFDEAYYAYMRDDYDSAALYYMLAAEKGYELAQSNVAWLLDERTLFPW
jgi:SEL1 protein